LLNKLIDIKVSLSMQLAVAVCSSCWFVWRTREAK